MTSRNNFRRLTIAAFAVFVVGASMPAAAQERPCATEHVVGNWVFATEVGRQAFAPDAGDITAIGTFTVDPSGMLNGVFDVAFEDDMFIPGIPYNGSINVNPDCRGTMTFVTGAGSMRTDSLVIINRNEFRGMSQDVNNLWTYTARRVSMTSGPDSLDAKIDAIMTRLGLVPKAFESAK